MTTHSPSHFCPPTAWPRLGRALFAAIAATFLWASPASAQLTKVGVNPDLQAGPARGTAVAFDPVNNVYLVVGSTAGNEVTPLYGVFTDLSGNPLGAPIVIKGDGEHAHFPRVTYSPEVSNGAGGFGGFLVTWHGGLYSLSVRTRIVAYPNRLVTPQGQIPSTSWQEAGPGSAYSMDSNVFLVVWQAGSFSIWGSLVDTNGNPVGSPINISNLSVGGARDPSVAWNPFTNEFGVVYSGWGTTTATTTFALVTASGVVKTRNMFNTAAGTYITDLTFNHSTGRFLAAWSQGGSYVADIDGNANVLYKGLASTVTGSYDGLSLAYNPISGSTLMVGQGPTYNVWAAELNAGGIRISPDTEVTATNKPSFYPRVTANTNAVSADWDLSFFNGSNGHMHDQVVRTSTRLLDTQPPQPPAAFSRTSPANGATGQSTSPTLSWTASAGATSFEYCIDASNDNACSAWTSTGTNTSVGLSSLTPGTTLFWHVRAVNTAGTTYADGSATTFWSFTTQAGPPPPPGPVSVCTTPDPFGAMGGGQCIWGGWTRQLSADNGRFAGAFSGFSSSWTILPATFDTDAEKDVFLFNTTTGDWLKMLNNTPTAFSVGAAGQWWSGWKTFVMDLDGDGISDLFLYDPVSGQWFKCISTPTGFTYLQGWWNPGWELIPVKFNDDAFGDLFLINRTTGRWFRVLGQSGAGFTYPQTGFWAPDWNLHPGDFNGDGKTDLFLHRPASGEFYVAINGIQGFSYMTGGGWAAGWTPYVVNLATDLTQDLFLYNKTTGEWLEMQGNGAGQFYSVGGGAWSPGWDVYPADFNGDGRTDVLLYQPDTGLFFQAMNTATGSFSYVSGYAPPGLTIIIGG